MRSKECIAVGCHNPAFAKGWCRWHQYMRTDKPNKPPRSRNKPLFKSKGYISPVSKNKRADGLETSFGFNNQKEMFDSIWESRSHVCMFTGEDLEKIKSWQFHWMFMHVLSKGLYPLWKLNPANIVLGHPDFHTAADNFTEDERLKHPEWKFDLFFDMQEQKKKEYIKFLKDNLL